MNAKVRFSLFSFLIAPLAYVACKPEGSTLISPGFILGNNDIILSKKGNASQPVAKVENSSVLLVTELVSGAKKVCSGTLVIPEKGKTRPRIVSNHHCFYKTDANDNVLADRLEEACVGTKVAFSFREGSFADTTWLKCVPGTLRTTLVGDLAVFEIEGNLPVGAIAAKPSLTELISNEPALVVHFPSIPENFSSVAEAKVRLHKQAFTTADCKIVGVFPKSEWTLDPSLRFANQHTCDLEHGSSGSGLWSADGTRFIGVNWGGIEITYNKGSNQPTLRQTNVATQASFVQAFLDNTSDELLKKAGIDPQAQNSSNLSSQDNNSNSTAKKKREKNNLIGACGVIPQRKG